MDVSNVSSQNALNSLIDNPGISGSGDPVSAQKIAKSSQDSYEKSAAGQLQAQVTANNYSNLGTLFSSDPTTSIPLTLNSAPVVPQTVQDNYVKSAATQWQAQVTANSASNVSTLLSSDPLSSLQPAFDTNSQQNLLRNYEDFKLQTPQLLNRYISSLEKAQANQNTSTPAGIGTTTITTQPNQGTPLNQIA